MAAKALGLDLIDTVPDQSSKSKYRSAVTHVDVSSNVLRRVEDSPNKCIYQYSTGVDASVSHGLLSLSNASDGVLLLLSPSGNVRTSLKNDAWNTLPFSSTRIISDKEALIEAIAAHKDAIAETQRRGDDEDDEGAHPDHEFVKRTFTWKNKPLGSGRLADDLEPLALWGSHDKEDYVARFSRELGIAACHMVRLRPFAVCVSGLDPSKLRAALRSIGS